MSLKFLISALKHYFGVILLCVALGAGAAAVAIAVLPQSYDSRARLMIEADPASGLDPYAGSTFVLDRLPTYLEFASSSAVVEEARTRLGAAAPAGDLRDHVSFSVPAETSVLDVYSSGESPEQAAAIANAVSESFVDLVGQWEDVSPGAPGLQASVLEAAIAPKVPAEPSETVLISAGLIGGLVVGLLLSLWLSWRDPFAKSLDDIAAASRTRVLGLITGPFNPRRAILRRLSTSGGNVQISFPRLFARLGLGAQKPGANLLTITSTEESVDTGDVAWRLGCTLVASGMRAIVVVGDPETREDLHLRRFTGSLNANHAVPELVEVGSIAPGGVISTAAVTRALGNRIAAADLVLFVGGTIGIDANVRSYVDVSGDVLLVAPDRPRLASLQSAAELAEESGAHVLGLVLVTPQTERPRTEARTAPQPVLEGVPA